MDVLSCFIGLKVKPVAYLFRPYLVMSGGNLTNCWSLDPISGSRTIGSSCFDVPEFDPISGTAFVAETPQP